MKTQLKKTLFVVFPLAALLVTTLGACSSHHGRSSPYRGSSYGGLYGQTLPLEGSYDTHRDERYRDNRGGYYSDHSGGYYSGHRY